MPYNGDTERFLFRLNTVANTVDSITGFKAVVWRKNQWRFQVGFELNSAMVDASNFDSITIEIVPAKNKLAEPLVRRTVGRANITAVVTRNQWNAGTHQHAQFDFTSEDTDISIMGRNSRNLLAICSVLMLSGQTIVAGYAEITIYESGARHDTGGIIHGGNVIPANSFYDANGQFVFNCTAGRLYSVAKGAHDTSITNGNQTILLDGNFTAQTASLIFVGTPLARVTFFLRSTVYLTAAESDARYLSGGVRWIGNWTEDTQILQGDVCGWLGSSWRAKRDSIDIEPSVDNDADWEIFAQRGGSGSRQIEADYAGAVNGSNCTFTMPSDFVAGSVAVAVNGVRQSRRHGDFVESGARTVVFSEPPESGDVLVFDYTVD